jgi:hypothetical protein
MNEEQEKPKRWYQNSSNIPPLMFMFVLLCGLIVALFTIGGRWQESPTKPTAYMTAREQIQNAVTAYQAKNSGALPTLNGTYTNANCSNCSVVNMSALLASNGGMLRSMPSGVYASVTDGNDNCGGNASLGCANGSHYIWIVNANGDVYSYCVGKGCTSNSSGYQGVWP